jgi:hypothetical protein
MTTADQREVVHRHVCDAIAGGARALTGGGAGRPGSSTRRPCRRRATTWTSYGRDVRAGLPMPPVKDVGEGIARQRPRFGLTAWDVPACVRRPGGSSAAGRRLMVNERRGVRRGDRAGAACERIGRTHGRYGLEMCNVKYVAATSGGTGLRPGTTPTTRTSRASSRSPCWPSTATARKSRPSCDWWRPGGSATASARGPSSSTPTGSLTDPGTIRLEWCDSSRSCRTAPHSFRRRRVGVLSMHELVLLDGTERRQAARRQ